MVASDGPPVPMQRVTLGMALPARPRHGEPRSVPRPRRAALERLCAALGGATGLDVVAQTARSYEALLRRIEWGETAVAWLPPMLALRAMSAHAMTPLAIPVRGESPWFWSALFCRADSPIKDFRDFRRARAVWVDPGSASGYLAVRATLRSKGVPIGAGAFRAERFARSHEAVVAAVAEDRDAVGATWAHLDADGAVQRAGWERAPVRVLELAGPIPADVIAARTSLPESLRVALARALTGPGQAIREAARDLLGAERILFAERAHVAHLELLGRWLAASELEAIVAE
jgi:phosphonate transport system substrate-binding protein